MQAFRIWADTPKMSGARLCTLLGELGFEGAEALDPDSFEWPFQYEDARPILDWICSSLRPSNVLSLSEVSQLRLFISFHNLFCFFVCKRKMFETKWKLGIFTVSCNSCDMQQQLWNQTKIMTFLFLGLFSVMTRIGFIVECW